MSKTTWRKELEEAIRDAADPGPVIAIAPEGADLDVEFNNGYGGAEGQTITVWTETRVYFPVTYDGSEWLESVPRNPSPNATGHFGGG